MPMTSDSMITDCRICLRDAPIVRNVANSRVRWAIVMPSVFAITKAPTKRAMPANASRKLWMNVVKPLTVFLSSFTCAEASRACAFGGSTDRISLMRFDEGTPLFDCTRITSSWPIRCMSPCAVARSNTAIVAPPIATPGSFTMPAIWKSCTGPLPSTPILSPTA
jgi:hypothetical protein